MGDAVARRTPVVRIVWASTSGHTEYAAELLADTLKSSTLAYRVHTARAETMPASDLAEADVLVLASSTWNTGGVEG